MQYLKIKLFPASGSTSTVHVFISSTQCPTIFITCIQCPTIFITSTQCPTIFITCTECPTIFITCTQCATKRSRKYLQMKKNVQIINELKVGKSVPDVAQQFVIGITRVYNIYKVKDELLKSIESVPQDSIRKTKENILLLMLQFLIGFILWELWEVLASHSQFQGLLFKPVLYTKLSSMESQSSKPQMGGLVVEDGDIM